MSINGIDRDATPNHDPEVRHAAPIEVPAGTWLPQALKLAGLAQSTSEGKRLVDGGAVTLDGLQCGKANAQLKLGGLGDRRLRVGSKNPREATIRVVEATASAPPDDLPRVTRPQYAIRTRDGRWVGSMGKDHSDEDVWGYTHDIRTRWPFPTDAAAREAFDRVFPKPRDEATLPVLVRIGGERFFTLAHVNLLQDDRRKAVAERDAVRARADALQEALDAANGTCDWNIEARLRLEAERDQARAERDAAEETARNAVADRQSVTNQLEAARAETEGTRKALHTARRSELKMADELDALRAAVTTLGTVYGPGLKRRLTAILAGNAPAGEAPYVYGDIRAERARQDAKWGGPEHDDEHDILDWVGFVHEHAERARWDDYRQQMLRVAALAVAAIQSHDRKAPAPPGPERGADDDATHPRCAHDWCLRGPNKDCPRRQDAPAVVEAGPSLLAEVRRLHALAERSGEDTTIPPVYAARWQGRAIGYRRVIELLEGGDCSTEPAPTVDARAVAALAERFEERAAMQRPTYLYDLGQKEALTWAATEARALITAPPPRTVDYPPCKPGCVHETLGGFCGRHAAGIACSTCGEPPATPAVGATTAKGGGK
jgi:hypothetical protein